jgi:thioredoxin 1
MRQGVDTFLRQGGAVMASSKVQILNDLNFDEVISGARGPVVVDFTATWCAPCKLQSAVLDELAEQSDAVLYAQVDVDDSPELAARFGVRGMPTLLTFRGGKEAGRRLGFASAKAVLGLVAGSVTRTPSAVTSA